LVLKHLPLDSPARQLYIIAYSQSFRNLFEVLTGFSVLGMLTSLLIKECSMNQRLESAHVLQSRVENELEVSLEQALSEAPGNGESKIGGKAEEGI
jgi:hypothetical protein